MKIYVIYRAKRSFNEVDGYKISERHEAVFENIRKAIIRVKELNSMKIQDEVCFFKEKQVLPVNGEVEQTVLFGKRFKIIHPKLKPVIFEYTNGIELRDKNDTIHITDIRSLSNSLAKKEGTIFIGREVADIIVETISNHNKMKFAVNG